MKAWHLRRGEQAEDQAAAWLQRQGLTLVARNHRCKGGEIDLIMRDGDTLVFVEVRRRNSTRFGGAAASVTAAKQRKLRHAALHYLQGLKTEPPCRFDIIGIDPDGIQWIRDAF